MFTANAIGSCEERFTGVEARIDAVDYRLDWLASEMDRRFEQRLDRLDRRFDTTDAAIKELRERLDSRLGWQTFLTVALGALILFDDAVRTIIGLSRSGFKDAVVIHCVGHQGNLDRSPTHGSSGGRTTIPASH